MDNTIFSLYSLGIGDEQRYIPLQLFPRYLYRRTDGQRMTGGPILKAITGIYETNPELTPDEAADAAMSSNIKWDGEP